MQKHLQCKKRYSQVKWNHTWKECMKRLVITRSDIRIRPRLSIRNTQILHWTHYLLFSKINWTSELLSAISCYKFHILKDKQENIKVTIICHLANFYLYVHVVIDKKGGLITNNCVLYSLVNLFKV